MELNQNSVKKLSSDIEKGVKQTRLDTSFISQQLADSFNISDKSVINKIKSQLNSMIGTLGKTWDGTDFNIADKGFQDFFGSMEPLKNTLSEHARLIQGATGIYDKFFDYFKDKKIYVSDALKSALGEDTYKELLQNNIGKIVRDATKGVDISSIWDEMKSMFPEHFSDNIITQAEQLTHTFDLVRKAREDMTQALSFKDMDAQTQQSVNDFAWKQASDSAEMIMKNLKNNIQQASEISKTTIDLDVNINTDKITSDIKNAIKNAGNMTEEPVPIDLRIDEEQLISSLRSAINKIASGDEPVKVDVQINKEGLQSELHTALSDIDLPVNIKVDSDSLADEIRAAVNSITNIEIDLHVNTNAVRDDVGNIVNTNGITVPMAQGNFAGYQQTLNNINAAGARGQSVFQRFSGSLREAFSTFTMANMLEDGIYKVVDAGKQGLETVKEFNDIKTDLAMATGENKAYINDLMESYNNLGQELGAITSDVASSADSWLRQGRSMSETNQLIKDSMVLSKDAQMGSSEASKILTATLNGFQMNADQAGHINDVLTSIDLQSASDAGGIGMALTKVASQANNAGVSLEKTAAMIATVKDVTQDSDASIGTALKSILSRMNQIKAGKFVDSETGESLNDVEKVLNEVGISMRDVNGQFMESEPIIDAVADKWRTFDGNTKKAVATAMAGTYQYNKLVAIFDNWDKVQSLTDAAFSSDGTAQKKFEENYMTSLEAKTNALKSSLENLATTVVSDDMYAGFLDGAKAVTDFVAKTDLLQASLAGLGTVGGAYALNWIGDMIQGFSDLSSAMDIVKSGNITDDAFDGLLDLTQGLSESQTRLVLSSDALSDAQRIAILMGQGVSQAEAQAAVAAMGLASAQGTATAATFSLSGAFKGLFATLMANPLILIAAGVTAAVSAISAYNHSVQESVSSARESGKAWTENNDSLQENANKITELRDALASGTLSEQEAAQAKSELLSIQESLTESYGGQVEGIDLINGSLTEQLALLDKVAQKEAEAFRNENKKGIEKATKEMEKDRHTYLGQFVDDGSKQSEAIKESIKKLQDTYGDEVFKLSEGMEGTGSYKINFEADATTAKEALNGFMSEMDSIQKQYGASDAITSMLNYASGGLEESKGILEEYQDIYQQAQKAELLSDDRLFKADGREQTASKWLSDYAKSIEAYNKAVSEGDTTAITQAKAQFDAIDSAMSGLAEGKMSAYADQIAEVRSQLNETAIATDKFNKAVKGQDSSDFGKGVSKTATALKELSLSDTDFKYAFETDGIQAGEEAVQGMVQAALDCGVISDTSASSVNNLVSMLVQLGVISSSTGAGLDSAANAVSGLTTEIEAANSALSGIKAATSLLTSQGTGKSINIEDFNSEELQDYTSALEYNNGALQLNADKVRELQKAKAEEAIQTNDNLKLEKQSQYMDNIAEIEELQDKLNGLSDAKSKQAETIQSSIDALLTENDSIVNQCSQFDLLSASLREATGAYQNWLDKQNGTESGDMFDDALGAMQHIDDTTQNTDSEYYGRIGRESYQAAVEFIIPESVDGQNAEAVQSYMDSIEHYFLHNEDGSRIGLDVAEFCQNAVDQGLMTLDEESGQYQIAGQRTMQDFVDGMNLSMPMVQAFFGEMREFGGQFSWADEAIHTLGDLGMAAGEAKARIEETSGGTGMAIQIDVSDIETTEGKISALENTISQMQQYKGTVGIDSSQVQDANSIIQYCITQKQMLEAPAVMSVDASQVDGEIGNAISLLQQFQNTQNTMELQASVGADTSEAEGQLNSLAGEINGLSSEVKVKLGLGDTSSLTAIQSAIQGMTPELLVKAGVDSSEVDAYVSQEKKSSGKVKWTNDTGVVDSWASTLHTSNGTVFWQNNVASVKTSFSATGVVNWVNSNPPSGGGNSVNGTAHANGTAHYPHLIGHANASGNWKTKTGGLTLVGELGREIVVDPYSGTWYTVGDNGAEFTNVPKGSIVFNHLQTEALLERGFVTGRGTAKAGGSAMVTGGISVGQANIASGRKPSGNSSSTKPNTNAQKANTDATRGNTTATNDNTKAAKKSTQVFDWVERRLKYFADKTKAIADSINDYISSSQKKSLLQKQIYATNSEMHVNYRSARAYYSKAQSLGLSSKTRKLIEEGRYTLDDIDTSTESGKAHYDKVQKYMNYYDEYTKCIDAVRELRNEQVELYAQWAAIPTEEAEKKIDKLTQSYNGLAAIQARLETAGMGGSAQALLMKQLDNTMRYANNNKKKTDAEWNKQNNRLSAAQTKEDTAKGKASEDKKALNTAKKNLTKKQKGVSLTSEEKKRVSSGQALSTKGLKGKKKQLVQEYNAALKKSQSSDKAYKSAQSYTKKVQNSDEYKNAKDAKHTNDVIYLEYKKNWEAAKKAYDKGDSLSYQNYLVDQELALLKQQNDAKNTAYRKANANTHTATKRKDSYKSKVDSIKKKGKSYSKKYAKYLTAEQEKQLAAGKKINTSNIKNANVKKIIDQYNVDLQNAMNSYTAATQQLTAAQEAEAEAAANAAQSQAEYAQAQVEAEKTKFDNIKKYYEQRIEYQESWNKLYDKQREYDKIHGDYTTSESFDKPINEIDKAQRHQEEAVKKLQEQLNKAVKAGTIKEYSDEWLEMKSEIVDAQTAVQDYENQMEQLKQEQLTVKYEEMFDRAIEKAEKFKDKLETINSLLTEEMMYDYDTGQLTEFGALSIVLNAKQLDTSLTTLKDYVKKRQQIMDDFKAEKFGQETYDKLMAENDSSLQNALKNAQSYQQAILGIIKNQAKAEQDALFKVIDARKDALKKKKDYYDYDKTLKNKSKEIDLLKQQIAALDGVTDAQSKAEKARLEAELAEKQEDFDDTVKDHVYDLQVEGLDDLKDQLSEDFEKWSNELSANLEKMSQAIADAVKNVGNNTADAMLSIGKILEQFGIKAGDLGISAEDLNVSGLKKYHNGAKRVGKDVLAVTNDGGREIIVTKQGVITPMKSSDGVIPNNMTETLMDMAAFWQNPNFPKYTDMFKVKPVDSNGGNISFNYSGSMVNVDVQGDMTKETLPDLQTILKQSSKYTQNEMRKNLKRFG
ncbi:MAG: phage tail tape measure protein [Blautia caecimuris]